MDRSHNQAILERARAELGHPLFSADLIVSLQVRGYVAVTLAAASLVSAASL
jgi:hypothetical protein